MVARQGPVTISPNVTGTPRTVIASRAQTSSPTTVPQSGLVHDPVYLQRMLQQVRKETNDVHSLARSNPLNSGVIQRNIVFATNQIIDLAHGLGRPYQGWLVLRAQGGPATLAELALPTGLTTDKYIRLQAFYNGGTHDVMIF